MGKILVITEKPSVAKEVARVVGANNRVVEGKDGKSGAYGYFEGNNYCVSWCFGHLLTLAYMEEYDESYSKWDVKGLPFIPGAWRYTPLPSGKKQYGILKKLLNSKDISEVICATDADREGELIFRLVYNDARSTKPVKRLWISSMEDSAIRKGLASMKSMQEYDSLYHAASARQKADWIVGLNATRYFTCRFSKYPEVVNIGRVQTPTVNLIVQRQRDIDNFVPKAYYVLTADTGTFKATLKKESKSDADSIIAKCDGKSGYIESIRQERKKTAPPELYALTNLQQEADSLFGFSATETLNTAQALYEKKLLTYPRTDSRYLASDMKESTESIIAGFLAKEDIVPPAVKAAVRVPKPSAKAIINDKKVTGHHAIIPTLTSLSADLSSLSAKERKIFYLVLYRLLAAVSPHYEYLFTKVVLNVQGEQFTATGNQPLVGGWRDVVKYMKDMLGGKEPENKDEDSEETQDLPELKEGDVFNRVQVTGKEKFTTPPSPYTEATLLKDMQNIGQKIEDKELKAVMTATDHNGNKKMLGTSATQGAIIDKIIKSNYVSKKGRKLEPTEKAYKLIDLVPEAIKSPVTTAEWERFLEDIKEGKRTEEEFILDISNFARAVIATGESMYQHMPQEDRSNACIAPASIGNCPQCGEELHNIGKGYACPNKSCDFVLWKTVAHKAISDTQLKKLLERGKTDLIKGFKSSKGNDFNAYLVLDENGKATFAFDNKR